MPVKINGNILKNIQVHYREAAVEKIGVVEKVGVAGSPVFLKIDNDVTGSVYTNTITGSAKESSPFFEVTSNEGVRHFTLGLRKWKNLQGVGSTEINLYTVVRMEVLDSTEHSSGYSYEKKYLIHIWGSDISDLTATIQSDDFTTGENKININTTAPAGTKILDISLENDGNSVYVKVFSDSSGNSFSLADPKTSWYVEGASGSPKYTVYAYGDATSLYELRYYRGETPLKFL